MLQTIPQAWVVAEMPDGTHLQLVVPEPELEALLRVLKFNKARSVSYAWQAPAGELIGTAAMVGRFTSGT